MSKKAPPEDLTGRTFERLTAISFEKRKRPGWNCECSCGKKSWARTSHLLSGKVKSCGCYSRSTRLTHGHRTGRKKSPEFRAWLGAKDRCYNKNSTGYSLYGGRGIVMFEEWKNDFVSFLNYIGPRPEGMSLDRIDCNGNYEPGNVRWATPKEQANNQRRTKIIKDGMSMAQYSEHLGIDYKYLYNLLQMRKLPLDEATARCIAKRDGLLVEFFRNRRTLSSLP